MLTSTFFKVLVITGLKPTRMDFVPSLVSENAISIINSRLIYNQFIANNMKQTNEISYEKYVAIFTCWLSSFLFFSKSTLVPLSLMSLARLLHEGVRVNLCKLLLGNLYPTLSKFLLEFKASRPLANFFGPLWFFYL